MRLAPSGFEFEALLTLVPEIDKQRQESQCASCLDALDPCSPAFPGPTSAQEVGPQNSPKLSFEVMCVFACGGGGSGGGGGGDGGGDGVAGETSC